MKKLIIILFACQCNGALAQKVVFDFRHLQAVTQNAAVRSSTEAVHDHYLGNIRDNIDDLNTNVAAVVLAQHMIYQSLANVNSALKNGLTVKAMAATIADMSGYINQAIRLAAEEPYLLAFATQQAGDLRKRALGILSEVSGYILRDDNNILADFNARDQLLRQVSHQLQIMAAIAYGAWKAMFWAKQQGLVTSVNPYSAYISQDRLLVAEIIRNANYLNP